MLLQVPQLMSICPTPEELDIIRGYIDTEGKLHNLAEAEKFFYTMGSIPRVQKRLQILSFKQSFMNNIIEIEISVNTIAQAILQVILNETFKL